MNTMKNEDAVPRALREVWEWKESVADETKGLTTNEALKVIHHEVQDIRKKYGFPLATAQGSSFRVAEDTAPYGREK